MLLYYFSKEYIVVAWIRTYSNDTMQEIFLYPLNLASKLGAAYIMGKHVHEWKQQRGCIQEK